MQHRFRSLFMLTGIIVCLMSAFPAHARTVRNVRVTAYHSHRTTSGGSKPHRGTCAAPGRWHGYDIHIPGVGWRRVTDTCRHGVDIWMPNAKACKRWGRRSLTIRVVARGGKKARGRR
jgi:3D (Asp-Asp-Asp) domain-containing protein